MTLRQWRWEAPIPKRGVPPAAPVLAKCDASFFVPPILPPSTGRRPFVRSGDHERRYVHDSLRLARNTRRRKGTGGRRRLSPRCVAFGRLRAVGGSPLLVKRHPEPWESVLRVARFASRPDISDRRLNCRNASHCAHRTNPPTPTAFRWTRTHRRRSGLLQTCRSGPTYRKSFRALSGRIHPPLPPPYRSSPPSFSTMKSMNRRPRMGNWRLKACNA